MTVLRLVVVALVASVFPPGPASIARAGEEAGAEQELDGLAECDTPVELSFKQVTVRQAYEALSRATGVDFQLGDVDADRLVDAEISKLRLCDALARIGAVAGTGHRLLGPHSIRVDPIRVAGEDGVTLPVIQAKVDPIYPAKAQDRRLEGRVVLQAVVDRTGRVTQVEALKSEPADFKPFVESAIAAVRQWRYSPATRDGEPVDVYFTVRIDFRLAR